MALAIPLTHSLPTINGYVGIQSSYHIWFYHTWLCGDPGFFQTYGNTTQLSINEV